MYKLKGLMSDEGTNCLKALSFLDEFVSRQMCVHWVHVGLSPCRSVSAGPVPGNRRVTIL